MAFTCWRHIQLWLTWSTQLANSTDSTYPRAETTHWQVGKNDKYDRKEFGGPKTEDHATDATRMA